MSTHVPSRPQPRFALFRGRPLVVIAYGGLAAFPLVTTFVRPPADGAARWTIAACAMASLLIGMAAGTAVIRGWYVAPAYLLRTPCASDAVALYPVTVRSMRVLYFAILLEFGVWTALNAYRIFANDFAVWRTDWNQLGFVITANMVLAATLPTAITAWNGAPPSPPK